MAASLSFGRDRDLGLPERAPADQLLERMIEHVGRHGGPCPILAPASNILVPGALDEYGPRFAAKTVLLRPTRDTPLLGIAAGELPLTAA